MATKKYVSLSKLSTFLDNLTNKFAALSHKHTMSDITDFTGVAVDSELSSTSSNPVENKVLDAEFEAISQSFEALELVIDGKLDTSALTTAVNDALAQAKASGEFDGVDGEDGIPATHTWEGTVLTIASASGTSSADLKGDSGYSPIRGTDYWTDADKAEIKSYVDEAILGGAW